MYPKCIFIVCLFFLIIPNGIFSLSIVIFAEVSAPEQDVITEENDEGSDDIDPGEVIRSRFEEGILDYLFSSPHIAFTAGQEWRQIENKDLKDALVTIGADVLLKGELHLSKPPLEIPYQGRIEEIRYQILFSDEDEPRKKNISGELTDGLTQKGLSEIFTLGRLVGKSVVSIITNKRNGN